MDYILETQNLVKVYHHTTVVSRVNLHVRRGEIYGFVGPNGAGKSTVMKLLLGLIRPDSGESYLFGERVSDNSFECLKRIGSFIESPCFYEQITGPQNLALHCDYMGFHNRERIDEVLRLVGLHDVEKKSVSHYSMGMKQRLAIARAILTKPELLILDEPVNALDPEGIREMRLLFRRLNQEYGTTIFISSHILSEVEQIADTIGIIRSGRLLQETPIEEIRKLQTEFIHIETTDAALVGRLITHELGITDFTVVSGTEIEIYDLTRPVPEITAVLVRGGAAISSIGRKQNSLEDYFFQVIQENPAVPSRTRTPDTAEISANITENIQHTIDIETR